MILIYHNSVSFREMTTLITFVCILCKKYKNSRRKIYSTAKKLEINCLRKSAGFLPRKIFEPSYSMSVFSRWGSLLHSSYLNCVFCSEVLGISKNSISSSLSVSVHGMHWVASVDIQAKISFSFSVYFAVLIWQC